MNRIAAITSLLLALSASAAERPALTVVISVDQFRYDYLERFRPWFGTRGFLRFEREGATFTNARQRHSVTSTGPGHAAIGGGTLPSENGIIANRWLDRDAPAGVEAWRAYFADTSSAPFDPAGPRWWKGGGAPRFAAATDATAILGSSLADSLKDTKVISIALTDRAAILMGGRSADAVYWFDGRAERFVSSPHYRSNPAVLAFNELVPGYRPASSQWNRSIEDLSKVTFDPSAAWPLKNTTYAGTFPHAIPTLRSLQYTPFAHEMLLDLAQHVLAVEEPGLLFVGISSTDYLGHLYGPDSLEVAESAIRLDRALGSFLDALERRYQGRALVVLTADHGIQSIPEIARLRDPAADAGRIDLRGPAPNARFIRDLPPARIAIERGAAKRLGLPFSLDAPLDRALVLFFEEATLYLHPRWRSERARRAVRDAVRDLDGVAGAWTNSETLPPLLRNSFHPDRSGDVLLTLRPGWIWMWGSNSTTHGQPVEADLHVPLMLLGPGIVPGRYDQDVSPLDLAKSIGRILGVEAGGRESRVLPCVAPPEGL